MLKNLTTRLACSQSRLHFFKSYSRSSVILPSLRNGSDLRFSPSLNSLSQRYFSQELIATWPEAIKKFLEREKILQPTLIQEKTLETAMKNKDLVGVARTGSGKTLAFVIPAILKILKSRQSQAPQPKEAVDDSDDRFFSLRSRVAYIPPRCLVLAPTRELANQINEVFGKFRHLNIQSIALVGGSSRGTQMRELGNGNFDVLVATPGRLMDLLETKVVDLSKIEYLVLDEADRMLDMGFEPQIRRILTNVPEERQTLMWSATWPQEIQALAAEFLKDYEHIAVDSENLKANPNIKQVVKVCKQNEKLSILIDSIRGFEEEVEVPRVLVFVNTKRLADALLLQLMRNRIKAIALHGDRSQKQRDDALRLFKNRMCHILVATDVAARGLDISDITHVINYDFPKTIEDYIHRIGRTARHERSGIAVSMFTENDASLAKKLVQVLKETNQAIPDELNHFVRNHHNYRSDSNRNERSGRLDFYSSGGTFSSRNRYSRNYRDVDNHDPRYNNQQQWSRSRDSGGIKQSWPIDDEDDSNGRDLRRNANRQESTSGFKASSLFAD